MKEQVSISKIKGNPNNPRVIKNDKFKKLVQSIKDFPEMLELRPIVVDENMMVLGGNMRLRASKEAGLTEVWIDVATGLSEEQKQEFVVKDNVGFGDWEWDMLANEWDSKKLNEWGLDVWLTEDDIEEIKNPENSESENPFANEIDSECNYIILKFTKDIDWIYANSLFKLEKVVARNQAGKHFRTGVGRVLDGISAIKTMRNES
tara:strand:- start:996 stop:1610 length:615 start_codon:yes stop_codon:yes gene_type:complete